MAQGEGRGGRPAPREERDHPDSNMFKKVLKILSITLVVIIAILAFWIRLMPKGKISFLAGKDNLATKVLCFYPVRIQGDSMKPVFSGGELVNFNKCFAKEELAVGTIIMFRSGEFRKVGKIKEIRQGENGVYYKISQEARPGEINDVYPDMVEAIYNQ
jgi:signal peptidase I